MSQLIENITVNTQSSIRVAGNQVVYFDPLEIAGAPQDADVIFVTHAHYDHFSPEDIAKIKKDSTVLVAPESMKQVVSEKSGIAEENLVFLVPGANAEVCGLPVKTVRAYNPAKQFHPLDNQWQGYVVTLAGENLYVSGDTDATEELKAVSCDIAMIPVGGKYTMNTQEAAEAVAKMGPKVAIPTHFGTIIGEKSDGRTFEMQLKELTSQIEVVQKLWA